MKPEHRSSLNRVRGMLAGGLALGAWLALAAEPPVQFFYVPEPEDQLLDVLKTIELDGSGETPVSPVQSYVSMAAIANNTVIYYDHWEDGYEPDISSPTQSTTEIWGDNDASNGKPPGFATDVINAGTVVTLKNAVPIPRVQSNILFDGRDRIATSQTLAITRLGWATGPDTLLSGAVEVFDTDNWGTDFRVPVGEDIADDGSELYWNIYEYVGIMIMAKENGTSVQIDKDANGIFEATVTLSQGQSHLVNGGVKVGGHVVATKPVQVVMCTGDRKSQYAMRDSTLLPTSLWSTSYTTPVTTYDTAFSTSYKAGTTVWLYNPGSSSISVTYQRRNSSGNLTMSSLTVPGGSAGGYLRHVMPDYATGARFYTTGDNPATFYAFSATDSTATSGTNPNWIYDWGFTLVPQEALTPQVQVALGLGRDPTSSSSPSENGNPVWVTLVGNGSTAVTVYADYDGDGLGSKTDPNGNKYDADASLKELQQYRFFDTDGDQTGMIVYILPGQGTVPANTRLAAAWGQYPPEASAAAPGLDSGTGIPPTPLFNAGKASTLVIDADADGFVSPGDTLEYDIRISNISRAPVANLKLTDTLPPQVTYVPNTTQFKRTSSGAFVSVPDDASGTPFPLDDSGYAIPSPSLPVGGQFQFIFRVTINADVEGAKEIVNTGVVEDGTFKHDIEDRQPLYAALGDRVWNDRNRDGIQDGGEPGLEGVTVFLDANEDGKLTFGELTEVTDDAGNYEFVGLPAGTYSVRIDTSTLPGSFAPTFDLDGIDTTPHVASVELAAGQRRIDVDFGYYQLASIGDLVWDDANENGLQDSGELGLSGITVTLYTGAGVQVGSPEVTDENGLYSFTDLVPGEYYVVVTAPDGYVFSPKDQGSNDTVDSDANGVGRMPTTTLAVGENDMSWDAGLIGVAAITGFVFEDQEGPDWSRDNPIAGVTVKLYYDGNGDTFPDDYSAPAFTTTTDENGYYEFLDLPVGYMYVLIEEDLPDYLSSYDVYTTPTDNRIALTVDDPVVYTLNDFWDYSPENPGDSINQLGSMVWSDVNGNGVYESATEQGIDGVDLQLWQVVGGVRQDADSDSGNGMTPYRATTTADGGLFLFSSLPPGDYQVEIPESNFAEGGALQGALESSANANPNDDRIDNDNNGIQDGGQGTVIYSPVINLANNTEPVDGNGLNDESGPGADQDNLDDNNGDMTVDFGMLPNPPTAARLAYFRAIATDEGSVHLSWRTLTESDMLGFRLERMGSNGQWTAIESGLIPTQGNDYQPQAYNLDDPASAGAIRYRLVAVDLRGGTKVLAEASLGRATELRVEVRDGSLRLELRGRPETRVLLESAADPARGPWESVQSVELDSAGQAIVIQGLDGGGDMRFYRVIE